MAIEALDTTFFSEVRQVAEVETQQSSQDPLLEIFIKNLPWWEQRTGFSKELIIEMGIAGMAIYKNESTIIDRSTYEAAGRIFPLIINELMNLKSNLAEPEAKAVPETTLKIRPQETLEPQALPTRGNIFKRIFRKPH